MTDRLAAAALLPCASGCLAQQVQGEAVLGLRKIPRRKMFSRSLSVLGVVTRCSGLSWMQPAAASAAPLMMSRTCVTHTSGGGEKSAAFDPKKHAASVRRHVNERAQHMRPRLFFPQLEFQLSSSEKVAGGLEHPSSSVRDVGIS